MRRLSARLAVIVGVLLTIGMGAGTHAALANSTLTLSFASTGQFGQQATITASGDADASTCGEFDCFVDVYVLSPGETCKATSNATWDTYDDADEVVQGYMPPNGLFDTSGATSVFTAPGTYAVCGYFSDAPESTDSPYATTTGTVQVSPPAGGSAETSLTLTTPTTSTVGQQATLTASGSFYSTATAEKPCDFSCAVDVYVLSPGESCEATSDATSSEPGATWAIEDYDGSEFGPLSYGLFSTSGATAVFTAPGTYATCAYLSDESGSSDTPYASASGSISVAPPAGAPSTDSLTLSVPSTGAVGQQATVTASGTFYYTAPSQDTAAVDVYLLPAGESCEATSGATSDLANVSSIVGGYEGPGDSFPDGQFTTTGATPVFTAPGTYEVCGYLSDSWGSDDEPHAEATGTIDVPTPPSTPQTTNKGSTTTPGPGTSTKPTTIANPTKTTKPSKSTKPSSTKSTTAASCVVPRTSSVALSTAKARIRAAHCTVGAVTYAFDAALQKGDVVALNKRTGLRLAHGSKVGIRVSWGSSKAVIDAARSAWIDFTDDSAYGSAKAGCALLGPGIFSRYLKPLFPGLGSADCTHALDESHLTLAHIPKPEQRDCGTRFTPSRVGQNVDYAVEHSTYRAISINDVRVALGADVEFLDMSATETWVRKHHRWELISGPPPLFTPQC